MGVTVTPPVVTAVPQPLATVQSVSIQKIKLSKHKTVQEIVLKFSEALDAADAENVSAYTLATVAKSKKQKSKPVALSSATYNASALTVTLLTRKTLVLNPPLDLTVHAASVLDALGRELDGKNSGQPGANFTAALSMCRRQRHQSELAASHPAVDAKATRVLRRGHRTASKTIARFPPVGTSISTENQSRMAPESLEQQPISERTEQDNPKGRHESPSPPRERRRPPCQAAFAVDETYPGGSPRIRDTLSAACPLRGHGHGPNPAVVLFLVTTAHRRQRPRFTPPGDHRSQCPTGLPTRITFPRPDRFRQCATRRSP